MFPNLLDELVAAGIIRPLSPPFKDVEAFEFAEKPLLEWKPLANYPNAWDAQLGKEDDGVHFNLVYMATCYRRGPWRLLVEVCGGPNHHKWGCFDEADQPQRYYHKKEHALAEAELLAKVLQKDRNKK